MKPGVTSGIGVVLIIAFGAIGCSGSSGGTNGGGHVFQIDFAGSTERTLERWVVLHSSETSRSDLVDFATGEKTAVSITTANFSGSHWSPSNWQVEVDWLPVVAAQDAWTQGLAETIPATVTFGRLEGDYRVEVVSAEGIQPIDQSITVNGVTTTTTYQGAAADSSIWDPQADGTDREDWLVWPVVTTENGEIIIEQSPGWVNAVRLTQSSD